VTELPEPRELLAKHLASLLGDFRAAELPRVMWDTALGSIDHALAERRGWAWWHVYPEAELARLEEAIEAAFRLARYAVELQAAANAALAEEASLVDALVA